MTESPRPLIKLEKATFGYEKFPVIKNVSLTIERGEFIGLTGPNGEGKTTLFRGMLGLLPLMSGQIQLDPDLRQRIGYVSQRDQLDSIYPVTAADVVGMGITGVTPWYRLPNYASAKRVQSALEWVGLRPLSEQAFAELSGGQRQRVLIARALIINPLLLVLDEPTSGIDAEAEEQIFSFLDSLQKEGKSILMVSHHPRVLEKHARRILEVKNQGVTEK